MNLYEKLNRLDDSLVESKRIVKKKKLTEGYRVEPKISKFNVGDRVAERYNDSEFNVGTIIEIKKDAEGTQYLVKWDYSDREDEEWLYGDVLSLWIEHETDNDYDDNIDEMLTESTEKTTIEVKFEPYTRYEYEPVKTARVSGKDLLDALINMSDRMRLYVNSDYTDEYEEVYGVKLTAETFLERIEEQNGDGCDFIFYIKNLTTGEMLFDSGYEESEDWDDDIDEMLTEGNNVSSQLSPAIDSFLQDIAQMYRTITYKDIIEHKYTEEDLNKLKNYRRRFRAEIPYEGDKEADAILQDIAEKVADIVKNNMFTEQSLTEGSTEQNILKDEWQLIRSDKTYDPEGLDIDPAAEVLCSGTEEKCREEFNKLVAKFKMKEKTENSPQLAKVYIYFIKIEKLTNDTLVVYYPQAQSKDIYKLRKVN